jgi:hypothetical protein
MMMAAITWPALASGTLCNVCVHVETHTVHGCHKHDAADTHHETNPIVSAAVRLGRQWAAVAGKLRIPYGECIEVLDNDARY